MLEWIIENYQTVFTIIGIILIGPIITLGKKIIYG